MDIYTFLNEVVFAGVEGIIILLSFLTLTSKKDFLKTHKYKSVIFIIIYTVFSYWASTYTPIGYHTLILIMFTTIALALITSSKLRYSLILMLIIVTFFFVIEFIYFLYLSIFRHVTASDIIHTPSIKLEMSIIVSGMKFTLVALLYKSKKMFFKNISSEVDNVILSYFIFGIFLMGVFIFNLNFAISSNMNIFLYEALLFTIFLLFILLGFLVFKEKQQLLKIEHKFKLQEEYIKNIETIIDIVRREKHDFSNHLNTIHAMCVLNKPNTPERIKNYIHKLTNSLHSSYKYFNTGNDFIDGLLAAKSNFAFNNHIHFEVELGFSLDYISIDDQDLISILSNIIDNAFEAILMEENLEDKVVSIYTYEENDNYHISIANNGPMISSENIDKIFNNGFSSKKIKEDHGLGLYIVKQLVEKNNGEITVSSYEEETEFLIIFNKRKADYGENSTKHHQLDTAE